MSSRSTNDAVLTSAQLAARWSLPLGTLASQRRRGQGPPYFRVGRLIRYRLDDVRAFECGQPYRSSLPPLEPKSLHPTP